MRSLAAGSTPPRWVVIDDGWQCTDLDEPFRQPPVVVPTAVLGGKGGATEQVRPGPSACCLSSS